VLPCLSPSANPPWPRPHRVAPSPLWAELASETLEGAQHLPAYGMCHEMGDSMGQQWDKFSCTSTPRAVAHDVCVRPIRVGPHRSGAKFNESFAKALVQRSFTGPLDVALKRQLGR
jgi:hypothetical protein